MDFSNNSSAVFFVLHRLTVHPYDLPYQDHVLSVHASDLCSYNVIHSRNPHLEYGPLHDILDDEKKCTSVLVI